MTDRTIPDPSTIGFGWTRRKDSASSGSRCFGSAPMKRCVEGRARRTERGAGDRLSTRR